MTTLKKASLFSASALALAVASASHAYDFEVENTTVSVYGYAKLDLIYDVDDNLGDAVTRSNIGGVNPEGHTIIHANQSRIGFGTSTPLEGSTLTTKIEGDFWGGNLRLRHAYGAWNGILAGQTWTNFYGFVAGTPNIDFAGTFGTGVINRQAQLRYTAGNASFAVEDPDGLGGTETTAADLTDDDAAKSSLPDFTARYTDTSGPFKYSAAGVLRQLEVEDDTVDDSTLGWGIALEGAMSVSSALTLRGGITHGDGIGSYLNISPVGSPAYVDSNGDLEAIEGTGGTLGASLKAGAGAINAAYSVSSVELDDTNVSQTNNEMFDSLHVNYIWSPASRISYGIESSWHRRERANGDDADALRLQGMAMYSF